MEQQEKDLTQYYKELYEREKIKNDHLSFRWSSLFFFSESVGKINDFC